MIRKAEMKDTGAVNEIYQRIHDGEETGRVTIGWNRSIYPVLATAQAAVERGDLFVMEEDGRIVAAAIINQIQVPEYADCRWEYEAGDDQVCVLHTLVVDPREGGRGYGTAFVAFYEAYAREHGWNYLRMDTNERNRNARRMYAKLGYREPGIVDCVFNGIPGVHLVCLEKFLGENAADEA